MLDLNDMMLFVRVVQAGGFSQAAEATGVPKSTLSRKLAQLEARLGVRLLERTTRRMRPTEAGLRYLEHARTIVAQAEAAEREISQLASEPRGTLRVSASPLFGHTYLAPVIVEYLARYPEVRVELGLTYRAVDLVAEGVDVGFRFGPIDDHDLIARRLGPAPRIWCASPEYLATRGTPSEPHELADHDCIVHGPDALWSFRGPSGDLTVRVGGRLSVSSTETAQLAAEAGLGIVRLPSVVAIAALRAGRLVRVLRGWEPPDASLFAVYPSRQHLASKVRALVDLALARFGESAPWDLGDTSSTATQPERP